MDTDQHHSLFWSQLNWIVFFLVSIERYDHQNTLLFWCYGSNFALIKRYHLFFLMVVYKEAQILLLWPLSLVCLISLSLLFVCQSSFSFLLVSCHSLVLLSVISHLPVCLISLSCLYDWSFSFSLVCLSIHMIYIFLTCLFTWYLSLVCLISVSCLSAYLSNPGGQS